MRDSVIFYISHYEIVKQMDNEQLGKLYRTLFETAMGNDPKIDDDIKIPFGFINNQMVLDIEKYNNKCLKNKENGKLGGRPKKDTSLENEKPKKPNGYFENPNENENENENYNYNYNENYNENDNGVINKLLSFVEENFGRTLAPLEYEEIINWKDNELTRYAIKQAILNGKYNIKYISKILSAYERENIVTVRQAQEREREYENMRKKTKEETVKNERDKWENE